MSPPPKKTPVRIGLKKKSADADSDISDLMSASTMEALEEIVVLDVEEVEGNASDSDPDEDLQELPDLEDEIERDIDPDYVPEPQAGTSKGKSLINRPNVKSKRSLNLLSKDKDQDTESPAKTGKGRSSAPIWKYFIVSDRKIANGQIEKGACCIVEVGGTACMKRIMQNGSSTTGLNQHNIV